MKVDRFLRLIPAGCTMSQLEALVIESNFEGLTQIRFDHRKKLVHFSDNDLTFGQVPAQLAALGRQLQKIVKVVEPPAVDAKARERENVFRLVADGMDEEHKAVFHRMKMIEVRKQFNEKNREEELREAAERKAEEEAKRAAEERKRLKQERIKREQEKERKQAAAQRKRDLEQLAKKLKADVEDKGAARKTTNEISQALNNLENVKTEELRQLQQKVEEEASKRMEEKRRQQATHLDYLTRALRLEEKELIIKHAQEKMELDQESFEKEYQQELKRAKARHDRALEDRKRLGRMLKHKDQFLAKTNARRQEIHEKKMEMWRKRRAQEEQARLEREEQERQARIARQEEEERLRKEREEKRREEERQAAERAAEKARKEAEAKEREAELQRVAERQRIREKEIADKEAKAKEDRRNQSTYRPPGARGQEDEGLWRTAGGRNDRRENRLGARDRDRFGRGDRDSRFGGRGGRDERWGHGGRDDPPRDSRFGGRGGDDRDSRFGGRGGRDDRDSRFGGRGGRDDRDSRFGGRGGDDRDSRFGGRDRDNRFGGRGGDDRDSRFGGHGGRDDRDSGRPSSSTAYRPGALRAQRENSSGGWRRGGDDAPTANRDSGRASSNAYRPGALRAQRDSQRDSGGGWRRDDGPRRDNRGEDAPRRDRDRDRNNRDRRNEPTTDADGFTAVQGRRR